MMKEIRLQKYLAECGVASRRKAEEMISQGRVCVRGTVIKEMGYKINYGDWVEVDGKPVVPEEKKIYIMLNKPIGYVTTSKDQFSRKTVVDLIEGVSERIYPVGRLDYDTSGLLVLTNDGEFTYKLTHPRHEMKKTYIARIEGIPSMYEMDMFRKGLKIEDYITAPAKIRILSKNQLYSIVEICIHEGKNRQVRKMCETVGHKVIDLKRVAIGKLKLGNLQEGSWRHLLPEELNYFV